MTRRPALLVAAVALLGSTLTTLPAQAGQTTSGRPLSPPQAQRALVAAESALDPEPDERPGRDTTLALRDLALAVPTLEGAALRRARALLARPSDQTQQACDDATCVHYRAGSVAAGYPEEVLATLQQVRQAYLEGGYRPPRPDGAEGGDSRFDVYLEDTGADRTYGYCVPTQVVEGRYDTSAYCVLDDDFSATQFPTNTPHENLQVTTAHEYFHAVQFGYDYGEDRWLLEATATWAEDELYPDVDDNRQYLSRGPLGRPGVPLDVFEADGSHQYGAWIFFRYLSERVVRTTQGVLPTIVREIWDRLDARAGAPDDHSVQGISRVLTAHGTSLRATFGRFADGNRRPTRTYAEGSALRYPTAKPSRAVTLKPSRLSSGRITRTVDHLSSSTIRLVPSSSMKSSRYRVSIRLDLDSGSRAAAVVSTTMRSGSVSTRTVTLSSKGDGAVSVPFSARTVRRVEVTVANASTRYSCWRGTDYSCSGVPSDDDKLYRVTAKAYKR